jgi:hypothetical protein
VRWQDRPLPPYRRVMGTPEVLRCVLLGRPETSSFCRVVLWSPTRNGTPIPGAVWVRATCMQQLAVRRSVGAPVSVLVSETPEDCATAH